MSIKESGDDLNSDVMCFSEIAKRLKISVTEVEKIYFMAMSKILHPSNKQKIYNLLYAYLGDEELVRKAIRKGTWKTTFGLFKRS